MLTSRHNGFDRNGQSRAKSPDLIIVLTWRWMDTPDITESESEGVSDSL